MFFEVMGVRTSGARGGLLGALALSLACGGASEDLPSATSGVPEVSAVPQGRRFVGSLEVRLFSSPPGRIQYTLDGDSPLDAEALVYAGPIRIEANRLLSFVSVDEQTGLWSRLGTELYERTWPIEPYRPPARALEISDDVLFFAAEPEVSLVSEEVRLRSVGLQAVSIERIEIVPQGAFFEEGAFEVDAPMLERLEPGATLTLEVRYNVTDTLRTAALIIQTDDLRAQDGLWVISLGGRRATW